MSYSTWHFITPFPSSGWLFRNMVLPRFVSMWQEMFEKTYVIWLLGNYSMDIVTRWVLHQYTTAYTSTSLLPTSHTSTAPAAYEPVTFSTTLTTLYYRHVTAALEPVTQSLIISQRSRVSVLRSYVPRALTAASSFVLPPSWWPIPAGRRGPFRRYRPSLEVQPRYVSSILTSMSDTLIRNNNINLALVDAHYSVRTVIFLIIWSTPQSVLSPSVSTGKSNR